MRFITEYNNNKNTLKFFASPSSFRRKPVGPVCRKIYMVALAAKAWLAQVKSLYVRLQATFRGMIWNKNPLHIICQIRNQFHFRADLQF